jgi:hypothetical protein
MAAMQIVQCNMNGISGLFSRITETKKRRNLSGLKNFALISSVFRENAWRAIPQG